jgi:hypothetical protein
MLQSLGKSFWKMTTAMTYFYVQNHIFFLDQFSTTDAVAVVVVAVVSTTADEAIRLTLVLSLARLLLPVGCGGVVVAVVVTSFPEDFRSLVVFRHDSIRRRASSLDRVSCFQRKR